MSCFRVSLPLPWAKPVARQVTFAGTLAIAALTLGSSACSEAPAAGDCERLLMHIVDLEINSASTSKDKQENHKVELVNGTREAFIERCDSELKASQVTCGLKAKTSEELEACDD